MRARILAVSGVKTTKQAVAALIMSILFYIELII